MGRRLKAIVVVCVMAGIIGWYPAISNRHVKLRGGGENVPMLAAIQLFPLRDHRLNFSQGVDLHTTLSWKPGDDWKTVFQNALAERNMSAVFDDKTVSIEVLPENPGESESESAGSSNSNPASENPKIEPKIKSNASKPVTAEKSEATGTGDEPAKDLKSAGTQGQSGGLAPITQNGFMLIPLKPENVRPEVKSNTAPAAHAVAKDESDSSNSSGSSSESLYETLILPKPKPAFLGVKDAASESIPQAKLKNRKEKDVKTDSKTEGDAAAVARPAEIANAETENSPAEDEHSGIESDNTQKASKKAGRAYVAAADSTLRDTLRKWAETDSWNLVWESKYDYINDVEAEFGGDFETAVTQIVFAWRDARPRITADIYPDNKVVVITNNAADILD